ncbi:unnamed protein product [Rhodiola kirilowii]
MQAIEVLSSQCSDFGLLVAVNRISGIHENSATIFGMDIADRVTGFLLSTISLSIFTYYTFWVIILPFVDGDHFIHKYFLHQEYAILLPVFAGVALLSFQCIFVGFVMLKSKKKKT